MSADEGWDWAPLPHEDNELHTAPAAPGLMRRPWLEVASVAAQGCLALAAVGSLGLVVWIFTH